MRINALYKREDLVKKLRDENLNRMAEYSMYTLYHINNITSLYVKVLQTHATVILLAMAMDG